MVPVLRALSDDIEPVVRAASMEKVSSLARFLMTVNFSFFFSVSFSFSFFFFFSFSFHFSFCLVPFICLLLLFSLIKTGGEERRAVVTSEVIPIVRKLLVDKNVQVQDSR